MDSNKMKVAYCHPRYWLTWLGILTLFITSLFPYSTLLFLGRTLGRAASHIVKRRGEIAHRNLSLCFPDLSEQEIDEKVRLNFENSGIALLEMGMAWFWPSWRIRDIFKVRGMENIDQAIINGQGIIFLGNHVLSIEMGARTLGLTKSSYPVYRQHNNALLDYFFYRGRVRENKGMLDRKDFKGMLRVLKKSEAIWYAPDHDYGRHKSSVFAPFFAVENANTVSGTSALARVKNTCVIPMFLKRLPGTEGYELVFYPALEDFPSKDPVSDTMVINQQIEKMILECDTQYMWMHRRFKTRPEGEPSLY